MIDLSSPVANAIGLCGTACVLAAYAYINMATKPNPILFNGVNLAGALLLLVSLMVHFNLASFLLEIAWGSIAIWGLVRGWRQRRARSAQ
ncbi:CBU_0592 family membrane protein [Sphingopyxis sp. MWB1]|uniref:CBU_0592 family membrane protein n=1 Tax=Sphingopyxis sp. MWB1 TaxID=1537715 RepID=UPI00051A736D|nr:hypothetical protein [Sphingopyxis sp. MWB1]